MSVKFMRRYVTGDYEYAEIEADDFNEFVEADAALADHVGGQAVEKAVEKAKSSFGKTTTVEKKSGFGNSQQSLPDEIELGEHEGYTITIRSGKFGWYANAYNRDTKERLKNQNLPKGVDPGKFTLAEAIELWA